MSQLRVPAINQVALSGRLVQDAEYHLMDNGVARLTARIAVNRAYRDRNDDWQEETSFFDIILWQRAAERFAQRLHKGIPVFLIGRLRSSSWRDQDDNPHSRVEVQVRHLQVLERDASPADEAEQSEDPSVLEEKPESDLAAA